MKRIIVATVLFIQMLLSAGCAFKDIDKRIFITAIGIDPAENEKGFKVTLKIALPIASVKDTSDPQYAYLEREGETIGESLRMLETYTDKVLEFGHVKAIVINEKLFTNGIQDFMDYFTRRGDIQLIAYMVAARPTANEILKVEPPSETPSTVSLLNFFDNNATESPYITTSFLFQFRRDYLADGIDAFIPLMETNEDKSQLIVNKAVVAGHAHDPITLTHIETKYFNSLFQGKSGFDYKVENEDITLLLNIDKVKLSYKIISKANEPSAIKINTTFIGIIGESSEVLHIEKLEEYNRLAEKTIKEKMTAFFKTLQEAGLDPGFGLRYRATRLDEDGLYEKWEAAYKELPFDITVKVKLKSTGAIE